MLTQYQHTRRCNTGYDPWSAIPCRTRRLHLPNGNRHPPQLGGMIKADASFNCARSVLRPLSTSVNVANISPDGVIWWLRERCGKSEEVHSALKSDLAGGQMPSGLFGANAAWWALASWRSI